MDLGTRLVVVGTSGSGKTTMAVRLARALDVPHVELDALQHGPNWEQATDAQLRERAAGATTGEGWVVDGNYSAVRDVVWPRATAVIWLDYDRGVVMRRGARRFFSRGAAPRRVWDDKPRAPPRGAPPPPPPSLGRRTPRHPPPAGAALPLPPR